MPSIKIAPSILAADHNNLNNKIKKIEPYADLLHVDVMDGKFVEPVTFPIEDVKKIKTKLPLEAHLMVENPEREWIDDYISAGCSMIIIHEEATKNLRDAIKKIKEQGAKAALAIKPPTPLKNILPYLKDIDMVLIMSVNPGYTGQKFMPEIIPKIKELRKLNKDIDIEVDGGINKETVKAVVNAGANVIVSASAIFKNEDSMKAINELRRIAEDAARRIDQS